MGDGADDQCEWGELYVVSVLGVVSREMEGMGGSQGFDDLDEGIYGTKLGVGLNALMRRSL